MNRFIYLCISVFQLAFCFSCEGGTTIDGSNTQVSAKERLQDFLHYSRYPDNSRPADRNTPAPEDIPLMQGDASDSAEIRSIDSLILTDGSVQLKVNVRILKPGTYRFHSLLLCAARRKNADSDETMHYPPVATASNTAAFDHASDSETVTLTFYGLILREAGCTQFGIQSISGERIPGANDADIVASGGSVQTGALKPLILEEPYFTDKYRIEQFTDKKFDSPGKQQRIEELKREIELEEQNQP